MDTYRNAVIYLTGDFNQLNISVLVSETGLQQVVNEATRGNSILDLFLTNRPNEVHCSVFLPCDAMHKRGYCRYAVSVRPSVCHVHELRQNE